MRTPLFLLLLSAASTGLCRPAKPLNERSTELAWQAWLLVEQAGGRQPELGLARRKITPKSVFIAPTFSPESLPACADGYRSDAMGRCVRIYRLNESFHLDFLLERLNKRFPEPPPATTAGPLQFSIPLEEANETEVALVVTPAGGGGGGGGGGAVEVDVRRSGGERFDVEDVAAILRVRPESVEMTTIAEMTTWQEETSTVEATTLEATTAAEEATTTEGGEAIFFQVKV